MKYQFLFLQNRKHKTHDSSDRHNVARARRVQLLARCAAAAKHFHDLHRFALGALTRQRVERVAGADATRVDAASADLCVQGGKREEAADGEN